MAMAAMTAMMVRATTISMRVNASAPEPRGGPLCLCQNMKRVGGYSAATAVFQLPMSSALSTPSRPRE